MSSALDSFRNLVSVRTDTGLESTDETARQGAFVSWAALTTFPVASSAITIIWVVLQNIFPSEQMKSQTVPLILASVLGIILFFVDYTDPENKNKSARVFVQKLVIAMINVFFLTAAVLGIDATALSA